MALTNEEIEYQERVRAVCCHSWGIPPWLYDDAWRDGRLTTVNIQRALDVAIINSPHPEILEEYLEPGSIEARKEAAEAEKMAASWGNLGEFLTNNPDPAGR